MTIALSIGAISAALYIAVLIQFGWVNAIDWLALRLHRHAEAIRERHGRAQRKLSKSWIREIEKNPVLEEQIEEQRVIDFEEHEDGVPF